MGKVHPTLTQARLKELLEYDPETGRFRWKVARGKGGRWPADRPAGCLANGRWQIRIDDVLHYGYRLAWLYVHGEMPDEIDHKDGDSSNDRIENLRACTHNQNMQNSKGRKGKPKGVRYVKRVALWAARITANGKTHSLKYHRTKEEAVKAYNEAAKKYHGQYARLNG